MEVYDCLCCKTQSQDTQNKPPQHKKTIGGKKKRILPRFRIANKILVQTKDMHKRNIALAISLLAVNGVAGHGGYGMAAAGGTHAGDVGGQIFYGQDVLHHGGGGAYIFDSKHARPGGPGGSPLSIEDIHNKMRDALIGGNAARIKAEKAKLDESRAQARIASEQAKQMADTLKILKELDKEAMHMEKHPEVLAKKVIPVVKFTAESNPLKHHLRYLHNLIKAIQEQENRYAKSQEELTKLYDVTSLFDFGSIVQRHPNLYRDFLKAGKVPGYALDVPVINPESGSFYISPTSGAADSHGGFGFGMDNIQKSSAGHPHVEHHGAI